VAGGERGGGEDVLLQEALDGEDRGQSEAEQQESKDKEATA
jgi:hypothetical protein